VANTMTTVTLNASSVSRRGDRCRTLS
jgi:hypothetical protein